MPKDGAELLEAAILKAGSATLLAKALGVKKSTITTWKKRGVPPYWRDYRLPEYLAATAASPTRVMRALVVPLERQALPEVASDLRRELRDVPAEVGLREIAHVVNTEYPDIWHPLELFDDRQWFVEQLLGHIRMWGDFVRREIEHRRARGERL